MIDKKRPFARLNILFFLVAAFLLAACTGQAQNSSWPGLAADGDSVYVAYGPGVIAYDVASQSQKWSYPAETRATLQFYAAPSVDNGRVVVGDYGASQGMFSPRPIITIYGLQDDGNSVDELWLNDSAATDRIAAQALQVGDTVYVGTADNLLLALDGESGTEKWRFETGHSIWAQPTYVDGKLYISSLDRHIYALNAADGTVLWSKALTGALSGKPIVSDGLVFVSSFDNSLHALNADSGEEVWAAAAEDWIWSAPTLSDGVLYFADSKGHVYAVAADDGQLVWQIQAPGAVQTSPVVAGDKVYVASEGDKETEQGTLTAYAVRDGAVVWEKTTAAPIYTTPVIVGDDIIVALQSEAALLIGFDLESGNESFSFLPATP